MIRLARIRLRAVAAAAVLPFTAVAPSAADDAPAAKDPLAAESSGRSAARVLPELDTGGNATSPGPVFVLDKGRFSAFDPPGVNANELIDVNDRGQVAGTYVAKNGVSHGFLRGKRGRFTLIDAPGATATFILKINDRGQIVGNACDADPCETQRAYVRDPGGHFTTIRVPGSVNTQALGLDDRGRIVGSYRDKRGTEHGYLWQRGRLMTIDVRRANLTQLTAINNRGEMVGLYIDADGDPHGFYRSRRGQITTIDAPGGVPFTLPLDINDRGRIVGLTTDALPLPGRRRGPRVRPQERAQEPIHPRRRPWRAQNTRLRHRRSKPHRRHLRESERGSVAVGSDRGEYRRRGYRVGSLSAWLVGDEGVVSRCSGPGPHSG